MNLQPTLAGKVVKLEPLHMGDFESLFAVARDPLIWEQHPNSDRFKREVFLDFFDQAIASKGALIIRNSEGAVIGSSRFYDFRSEEDALTIGYTFLARAYWGGYYNGEVKRLMLDHAFKTVRNIDLIIGANNLRSRKAAERVRARYLDELGSGKVRYRISRN